MSNRYKQLSRKAIGEIKTDYKTNVYDSFSIYNHEIHIVIYMTIENDGIWTYLRVYFESEKDRYINFSEYLNRREYNPMILPSKTKFYFKSFNCHDDEDGYRFSCGLQYPTYNYDDLLYLLRTFEL